MIKILFVDHRDSFSENVIAALRARGCVVDILVSEIGHASMRFPGLEDYAALVLSPGPGRPEQYVTTHKLMDAWRQWNRPLLGICLGFQLLLQQEGCSLNLVSPCPVHGRQDNVESVRPSRWLAGFEFQGRCVFYNSWGVLAQSLSKNEAKQWQINALTKDFVAVCEHQLRPWLGIQYHPESFATVHGAYFFDAFVALLRRGALA